MHYIPKASNHISLRLGIDNRNMLGLVRIDLGVLELASRNFLLKKNIKLTIASSLGLRQSEKGPNEAQKARPKPEEASLCAPVPSSRGQLIIDEDIRDRPAIL